MAPSPHSQRTAAPSSWWRRIGWLLLIWAASVTALAAAAWGLKTAMRWAGLAA